MEIETELYSDQQSEWPQKGRAILAQYDTETIVVYQAFHPSTARYAVEGGCFGKGFKLSRMSWIKPNFLWMMYRSGWASKHGQQSVLAVRIRRDSFDQILAQAVHSTFDPEVYDSHNSWKSELETSEVRLQWDPDHSPSGDKVDRRAVQLGLRGSVLKSYARDWIISITDMTDFVVSQSENAIPPRYDQLLTPRERVYPVTDQQVVQRLQL